MCGMVVYSGLYEQNEAFKKEYVINVVPSFISRDSNIIAERCLTKEYLNERNVNSMCVCVCINTVIFRKLAISLVRGGKEGRERISE